jgi:nicotinate phosphoribosyltransferase
VIIRDFTDNDLYKFTTMNAVQNKFPAAEVRYSFINRGKNTFPKGFAEALREEVDLMKTLKLSRESEEFIRKKCYFFQPVYIDLLKGFRFNPSEVIIKQSGGNLEVTIEGLWYRTVLWEVPLLAIISELYFKMTGQEPDDYEQRAIEKARSFSAIGAEISDFGTRRRFSFNVQNRIVEILKKHCSTYLNGTSNVFLAMKHEITPMGTHPHEWFMYHGAHFGYRLANAVALENWVDVYHGDLGIALTDTFTSELFFKSFDVKYSKLFDGVRWDSGDPLKFTDRVVEHYISKRIDPATKTVVYSDALNLEKTREIRNYVRGRIHDVYGIGTFLTNDVGVKPLNMVIKLTAVKPAGYDRFVPAIKLSDSKGKYSGDPEEISLCLKLIN